MAKLKIYTAESVHNFLCIQRASRKSWTSVKQTVTRRSNLRTVCLFVFLLALLIGASFETGTTYGQNVSNVVSTQQASISAGSPVYNVTANPARLQEGFNTTLTVEASNEVANTTVTVNVTDPSGFSYTKMLSIIINGTGFGSNSTEYWASFTGGANTKYVGVYTVTVNETLATASFTVGLTDELEYRRTETVLIRAVGYSLGENITVSMKVGNASLAGYPKTLLANDSGVLTDSWPIPSDATPGKYQVQIFSTMSQTNKTVPDQDTFTVLGAICSVRTLNRVGQAVADAVVEVYNATSNVYLNVAGQTNSSGWALFNLDQGNYTFKVFFRNAEVGSLSNQSIMADNTFIIELRLVNLLATAETAAGEKVEFIEVDLEYNYRTRSNESLAQTESMLTNTTGMTEFHNLLTNVTYRVNAKRYDMLFQNTTIIVDFEPAEPWINLQLTLPNIRLNLHVLDSKGASAEGVLVKVYEFSAVVTEAPLQSFEVDSSGDASFTLPFGRYRLRASEEDVFLNETTVNLVEDPTELDFNLETANLEVTVSVYDYFSGPIANAEVRIERRNNNQYVFVESGFTRADGSVTFTPIIGGDSRILVYVAGKPVAATTQFLASGSNKVTLKLNEYVAVFGFAIETGVFTMLSFILVLAVISLVLMRGRLTRIIRRRSGR